MKSAEQKSRIIKVAAVIAMIAVLTAAVLFLIHYHSSKPVQQDVTVQETAAPSAEPIASIAPEKSEKRIFLIETSDIHGYLVDISSGSEKSFQYRLAYIAKQVKEARESSEYDDVLLIDGGDLFQGNPVSNQLHGAPVIAAMDEMQYDAVVLGNHEFDWDVKTFCADESGTLPAYRFGPYSGDPDIPVLACDLYDAASHMRVPFTKDYVIVEKAGVRIAIIGYIPNYASTIMTEKIKPYSIDSNLERFRKRVREINLAEKPDVTVVAAHAEPSSLAAAMDPSEVQLVTGGHKHAGIFGVSESGVPYIQGDSHAKGYASALIRVLPDGMVYIEELNYTDITSDKEALYDTPENTALLDEKVLSISHEAWKAVGNQMNEVLGYITVSINRNTVTGDNGSTVAGNWITGLMLKATHRWGTVAAFYNSGGIRTNLKCSNNSGRREITIGDIYTIAPFGNSLYVYEITGAEFRQQLLDGFRNSNYGDQMSGFTFTYTEEKTEKGTRISIIDIVLNDGTKVDPFDTSTLYRVCLTSYNATVPGSVFENKMPLISEAEAPVDHDAFIDILRTEAKDNNGYIFVDESPRGYLLTEAVAAEDAA